MSVIKTLVQVLMEGASFPLRGNERPWASFRSDISALSISDLSAGDFGKNTEYDSTLKVESKWNGIKRRSISSALSAPFARDWYIQVCRHVSVAGGATEGRAHAFTRATNLLGTRELPPIDQSTRSAPNSPRTMLQYWTVSNDRLSFFPFLAGIEK